MKKGQALHRILSLIIGLGVAVAICLIQLFFYNVSAEQSNQVETGQTEDVAFISMPSVTIPSTPSVVEANNGFSFIHEILFEESQQEEVALPFNKVFDKLLQTLFRVVISPNAP